MKIKMILPLFWVCAVFFLFACTPSNNNESGEEQQGGNSSGGNNGASSSSQGNQGNVNVEIGAHAALPSNKNAGKVQEMYNSWIGVFYVTYEEDLANSVFNASLAPDEARGTARIKSTYGGCYNSTGGCTASEAIGYGMILTSLMEDWDKFNKLLSYSKVWRYKINGNSTALMQWSVRNFTSPEGGSATDADIDIIAALFIAYQKTKNENYLNEALEIGKSIWDYELDANTRLVLPAATNEKMGNGSLYNISYISLPALKMLQIYDKDRDWATVLEKNLSYMEKVQNNWTGEGGLWPDWTDASGVPVNPDNGSSDCLPSSSNCLIRSHEAYYKEAPRIPWRIAWYYHWFGDARAKTMLDKGMAFLRSKGVQTCGVQTCDLKNFYSYAGVAESSLDAGARDWASLCALGLGNSANQNWMNSCNEKITNWYNPAVNAYYGNSLQLIYAMLFNGKY